ncbi:hypothetical protein AX774_g6159 [Zancudomyces culisetae]|uniref:Uncharacterized protein n=1 Tax=Zancudomyces culisetae TaxID=1213189 RepID=A0A1R1PHF7_ZANCU|nr:hypothetical protein AX774_g6159 [Zancudomyces culisetae]|eukprot:OMH80410.1 hypothetical protein AX774_g6159 [Zancudomyces culisetae]
MFNGGMTLDTTCNTLRINQVINMHFSYLSTDIFGNKYRHQRPLLTECKTKNSQAPAKTIGILRKNKIEQIPEIGEGETSKDFEPELHLTNLIINSNQFENPHNERRIEIKKQVSTTSTNMIVR